MQKARCGIRSTDFLSDLGCGGTSADTGLNLCGAQANCVRTRLVVVARSRQKCATKPRKATGDPCQQRAGNRKNQLRFLQWSLHQQNPRTRLSGIRGVVGMRLCGYGRGGRKAGNAAPGIFFGLWSVQNLAEVIRYCEEELFAFLSLHDQRSSG